MRNNYVEMLNNQRINKLGIRSSVPKETKVGVSTASFGTTLGRRGTRVRDAVDRKEGNVTYEHVSSVSITTTNSMEQSPS
jgi:ribosomal protein S3